MSWRLDPTKTGLLVVDIQEKLFPHIFEHERVREQTEKAIKIAKILGLPIYLTEQEPKKIGATIAPLRKLLKDVDPITKNTFSCASVLPKNLPKNMLVCGIEAHVCVRQTIYDLRQGSTTVYLLADAVSSRTQINYELAVEELRQDKVLIASVEAVAMEMIAASTHEKFRELLAVIK
jgi:nicotinamidase-related amidase